MRRVRILLLIIVVGTLAAFTAPTEKYFEIAKSLDIFSTLFKEVNAFYVDDVDPKKLIDNGIRGMLESLDPYTDYITEEESESFSIQTTGQYAGIGALIGTVREKAIVTLPYPGFPAYKAGVQVGDEFIAVNGIPVKGKPTSEISALLKGKPNTAVEIVLRRPGLNKDLKLQLQREKIKISNIAYFGMLEGQTGYIKLDDFTPGAGKEVGDAVAALKKSGAKGIILDLRENPGGLLYEAVNVANVFLPKGAEIVSTKGKVAAWNKTYKTLDSPVDAEIPLAVLTGQGSASASEIVAGAVQDYDRGVLIGQKTFGKGLVQTTRALPYNAQVKVTTAKYYIPSGRCIQALDYAHRKSDGTVERFADSLKNEYSTKGGRKVYDGGGLDPDVAVEPEPIPAVIMALLSDQLIFEYAVKYCGEHPQAPASLREFKISDAEYQKFLRWLQQENFKFQSNLEKNAGLLEAAALNERYYDELQVPLKDLYAKIEQNHETSLSRFKPEISTILARQIAFNYRLHAGEAEVSLTLDENVKKAQGILADQSAYRRLLSPQ